MKFRTEIEVPSFKKSIIYSDNILTIGSCFADNIANFLSARKFNVLANPFGVLYNPVSIFNSLKILKDNKKFENTDLIEYQSEWHSFYHHSDFSHHDQTKCLSKINSNVQHSSMFLQKADWIIITYGTSFVYRWNENGEVVSNCHKIPQSKFERQFLSSKDLQQSIERSIELIRDINHNIKIIFTISPIRHWKDGAIDNQLSKSHLIVSVHEVIKRYNDCFYFPSFEILMDDLRDYRYYEEDLLHPNAIAIKYIWQKFSGSVLNSAELPTMKKIERLIAARNHKVRNPKSNEHKKFAQTQLNLIDQLNSENNKIDLSEEKFYFESFLD